MAGMIEIWISVRPCLVAAAVSLATVGAMSVPTPASAGGTSIYDTSHYRPVHGRARNIFHNPVGKLSPGVTRRLPSLTPKPAEFDFGIAPVKIDAPAGSAAKARRPTPAAPLLPELSVPKKTP